MTRLKSPLSNAALLFAAIGLGALVAIAQLQGQPVPQPGDGGQDGTSSAPLAVQAFPIYGATATMAWSPDSRRLTWADGDEYWQQGLTPVSRAGIWVLDRNGDARRVISEARHHPVWTADGRIVSSCSLYANCQPGVRIDDFEHGGQQIVATVSAWTTAVASDGRVLFFHNVEGWAHANRPDDPWRLDPPEYSPQHRPQNTLPVCGAPTIGDLRVVTRQDAGLVLEADGQVVGVIDSTPPMSYQGQVVEPCVSPDGTRVAYLADVATPDALRMASDPTVADENARELRVYSTTAAGLGALTANGQPPRPTAELYTQRVVQLTEPIALHRFYGDTVSFAWSPSGQHMAFNASHTAMSFAWNGSSRITDQNGLWAFNASSGATTRIHEELRLHPAWLSDDQLVSVCSVYESETCTPGIAMTDLPSGQSAITQDDEWLHHTRRAQSGGYLYFNQAEYSWRHQDASGASRTLASPSSWHPPSSEAAPHCFNEQENFTALATNEGLVLRYNDGTDVIIDDTVAYYYEYSCWQTSHGMGLVQPCVSPDGQHVAYAASPDANEIEVRVYPISDR